MTPLVELAVRGIYFFGEAVCCVLAGATTVGATKRITGDAIARGAAAERGVVFRSLIVFVSLN